MKKQPFYTLHINRDTREIKAEFVNGYRHELPAIFDDDYNEISKAVKLGFYRGNSRKWYAVDLVTGRSFGFDFETRKQALEYVERTREKYDELRTGKTYKGLSKAFAHVKSNTINGQTWTPCKTYIAIQRDTVRG